MTLFLTHTQPIAETTEQFLSLAQQIYINQQGEMEPRELLLATIRQHYGEKAVNEEDEITWHLVKNSIKHRIEKIDRKTASDLEKWVSVGQMDLFGSGEFKIPSAYLPKSVSAAEQYMRDKSEQEQIHADELAKQWNQQIDKAKRIAQYAEEIGKLRHGVLQAGLNPEEVSVEQAIHIQEEAAIHAGHEIATGSISERAMRDLRP